jgi:cytochrome P450
MHLASPPGSEIAGLLREAFLTPGHPNPHPVWRRLRELGPVHRTAFGLAVFDAEGCRELSADKRLGTAGLLGHGRKRDVIGRVLRPTALTAVAQRAEALALHWLPDLPAGGEIDLVTQLAHPLPLTIVGELVGIPSQDRAAHAGWAHAILCASLNPLATDEEIRAGELAVLASHAHLAGLIRRRDARSSDTVLAELIRAADDGLLDEDDVVAHLQLVLVAALTTTTHAIGNAVVTLLRNVGAFASLRADPSRIPGAVRETLRYEPPLPWVVRSVRERMALGAFSARPGENVVLVLAAANRDPRLGAEPDRFDHTRRDRRPLSFGHGPHSCLGAELAEVEIGAALWGLLRRYRIVELASEAIEWVPTLACRGPRRLPLRCRS